MLRNPDRIDIYDYNVLKEYLRNQISTNPLFYSIYVYFRLNDKVLTSNEGFFKLPEFYDRPPIEATKQKRGKEELFDQRILNDPISNMTLGVLTISKGIPLTSPEPLGYLVVNIKQKALFDVIDMAAGGRVPNLMIMDRDRNMMYSNSSLVTIDEAHKALAGKELPADSKLMKLDINGENYLVGHAGLDMNGWTILQFIPHNVYKKIMQGKINSLLKIAVLILAVGFMISYFFALIMYKPWNKILKELSVRFKGGQEQPRADEASLVKEAIDRLMDEHANAQIAVKQYEPVIKDRFIYDLLHNTTMTMDGLGMESRLSHLHMGFGQPYFTALIVSSDLDNTLDMEAESNRLLIFNLIQDILRKNVEAEGTILDHSRFAFIINMRLPIWNDADLQSFKRCCDEINENVQRHLGVTLQFAFGEIFPGLPKVHESFLQAKRILNYKAVINRADVVFYRDWTSDHKLEYPHTIQKQLFHQIVSMDRKGLEEAVDQLFGEYLYEAKYPREKVQDMIVLLLSSVTSSLLQEGYDIGALFHDDNHIALINECQNVQELKSYILTYFNRAIDTVESVQDKKSSNQYIDQAIQYMESKFAENISISHIADHLGISSGYLSKMFKSETGKSPLEYLTEIRIKQGKLLLKDETFSLQQISEMLGYNDVHSFIRFFKKYEQLTPGEYRKRYM
jgi:AraC-like DNA-binding protein